MIFIIGPNESSKELLVLMNQPQISAQLDAANCVSIRIQSETESYTQFAEICKLVYGWHTGIVSIISVPFFIDKLVPLPSVFLIGPNGVPLTIVTESTKTVNELDIKIRDALAGLTDSASAPGTSANAPAIDAAEAAAASINPQDSAVDAQKKLEFYRAQIEVKRKQKEEEQRHLDKERELERRRNGQELRSFKERQNELELQQLKEERKRDKLNEQAVRKRILDQIAQDRATSKERYNQSAEAAAAQAVVPEKPTTPKQYNGTEARIQFRKPDGSVVTNEFLATDAFQTVHDYVTNQLLSGNRNFTLASSFPRHQFTEGDANKTLVELNLAPTAVILVLSSDKTLLAAPRPAPGVTAAVGSVVSRYDIWGTSQWVFWTLLSPVVALFGYLSAVWARRGVSGAQKRDEEEQRQSDNDA